MKPSRRLATHEREPRLRKRVVREEDVVVEELIGRHDVDEVRISVVDVPLFLVGQPRAVIGEVDECSCHQDGGIEWVIGVLALHDEELVGHECDDLACAKCLRGVAWRRGIVGEHGAIDGADQPIGHDLPSLNPAVRPPAVRDGRIFGSPLLERRDLLMENVARLDAVGDVGAPRSTEDSDRLARLDWAPGELVGLGDLQDFAACEGPRQHLSGRGALDPDAVGDVRLRPHAYLGVVLGRDDLEHRLTDQPAIRRPRHRPGVDSKVVRGPRRGRQEERRRREKRLRTPVGVDRVRADRRVCLDRERLGDASAVGDRIALVRAQDARRTEDVELGATDLRKLRADLPRGRRGRLAPEEAVLRASYTSSRSPPSPP